MAGPGNQATDSGTAGSNRAEGVAAVSAGGVDQAPF